MRSILALMICACGGSQATATVTVEPLPSASSASSTPSRRPPTAQAFIEKGCKAAGQGDLIDCTGASIDGIGACRMPLHRLGVSFEPPAVIAECFVGGDKSGIRTTGCMVPSTVWLIAATGGGFVMLHSKEELAKVFAPVTSETEALAFAVALTGSEVVKPGDPDAAHFAVTDARSSGVDFRVRLFTTPVCGCSHATSSVDYLVTRAGAVSEVSRTEVWEDPKTRGLCVD